MQDFSGTEELQQLRAEEALHGVGITTYGEGLVELAASLLDAVDTAGEGAPEDQVAEIVGAHVGPDAICCISCLFGLACESQELMCEETEMVGEADSLIEALGQTVWSAAYAVAHNEWVRLQQVAELRRQTFEAMVVTGGEQETS